MAAKKSDVIAAAMSGCLVTLLKLVFVLWVAITHGWWSWIALSLFQLVSIYALGKLEAPGWFIRPLSIITMAALTSWLFWLCWDVYEAKVLMTMTVGYLLLSSNVAIDLATASASGK